MTDESMKIESVEAPRYAYYAYAQLERSPLLRAILTGDSSAVEQTWHITRDEWIEATNAALADAGIEYKIE